MAFFHSHLQTAAFIIAQYKGDLPLSIYLKNFFAKEKKYGSKDRRNIAAFCYAYYRVWSAMPGQDVQDVMIAGMFLTTSTPSQMLAALKPEWNEVTHASVEEKLELLHIKPAALFPYFKEVSAGIDATAFGLSFLHQPKLYIRLRPNQLPSSNKKLATASLAFERITDTCLAFENGTKVEAVLEPNKDYVVQDYNSQQTLSVLDTVFPASATINIWDCCAASGGKSILAPDRLKNIQLTVSDVRDTILANLHKRFVSAAIRNFHSFEADLTHTTSVTNRFAGKPFDLVICDAPCTGSGTWSRTPEQLAFFNPAQIDQYSQLQKKITSNVIAAIKKGGYLLYITCSVFKKENEEVVKFLQEKYPITLVKQEVLKGYDMRADSMFVALLRIA